AARAQFEANAVYQHPKPAKLLYRLHEKRARHDRKRKRDSNKSQPAQQQRWYEFMSLVQVLTEFGYLYDYDPTQRGEAASAIRGDNELWLAIAMQSGHFDDLDPHHIAAAVSALVTETPRSGTYARLYGSDVVQDVLHELRSDRRLLVRAQRQHNVEAPIWLERKLAGLVENWALGMEWDELVASTSLDEGDLVRLMRRTLDFLSQVPHIPHLTSELKENAKRSRQLLDRFPISEVI
ncbi:MAG: DEAD/DEAH box helicase, partial [Cyanobacteria bacterium J06648_11]